MIHLVDDDEGVRNAMRLLLTSANREHAAYSDVPTFLAQLGPDSWGVVLLNYRFGPLTALDVLREFAARGLDFPVVVHSGEDSVQLVVQTIKAGAADYLAKPVAAEQLFRSLDQALAEEAKRRESRASRMAAAAKISALTPRENEVLRRLMLGERNKAVAEKLEIAPKTVEHHRAAIFRKLGVASLAAAALQYNAAKAATVK